MSFSRRSVMPLLIGMAVMLADTPARAIADGPDFYRVVGVASWDRLNLRAGPAAGYRVLARIAHDARFIENLGGCAGSWCWVRHNGVIGWVNTDFLAEDSGDYPPATTYRVTGVAWGDALNIRTGPSAAYPVLGSIPPNGAEIVRVGGCQGEWCRIRFDDIFGWVNSHYLAPDF